MDIHVIVSEWLLFNAKWAIFPIYLGENELHFDEMTMVLMPTFLLDQYA